MSSSQSDGDVRQDAVVLDYTNHRGERADRLVLPLDLWFGESEFHHDGPQWFLHARDIGKGADRDFAMQDVHGWKAMVLR